MLGGLSWFGPASAAHSGLTSAQGLMASTASGSLIQQAAVINDYALILESAQRQARRAIERAKDADERIREAKEDIRQAVDDQAAATARITAAQAAQARFVTSVIDLALGDAAEAAAADMAAAEEADARRDLQAAEERERRARRRLEHAEEDRREAQKDGEDAAEAVALARVGLVAAARARACCRPARRLRRSSLSGGRWNSPRALKPPPGGGRPQLLGAAARRRRQRCPWTWDQARQVPGGVWEGTKGIYEGGKFLYELNPTNAQNLMNPGRTLERYQQLAETGKYAWENPGEFGKTLINWEDLEAGRYGEWAGNLVPDAILAVATGGAGAAPRAAPGC